MLPVQIKEAVKISYPFCLIVSPYIEVDIFRTNHADRILQIIVNEKLTKIQLGAACSGAAAGTAGSVDRYIAYHGLKHEITLLRFGQQRYCPGKRHIFILPVRVTLIGSPDRDLKIIFFGKII